MSSEKKSGLCGLKKKKKPKLLNKLSMINSKKRSVRYLKICVLLILI